MKYFIVEGILKNTVPDENLLKEHIAFTSKNAMDLGLVLFSGLKADESGGMFLMKAESIEKLEAYLAAEPFKVAGVQDYRILEFSPHYVHSSANQWFER